MRARLRVCEDAPIFIIGRQDRTSLGDICVDNIAALLLDAEDGATALKTYRDCTPVPLSYYDDVTHDVVSPVKSASPPAAAHDQLVHGFVTDGLEAAFEFACTTLELTPQHTPSRSRLGKSCGAAVHARDGSRRWLKITGIPVNAVNRARAQEQASSDITGVPKPAILEIFDWRVGAVCWRALQTEHSISPVAGPHFGLELPPISDEWIENLRWATNCIAGIDATHYCKTPDAIAVEIRHHFGRDAPLWASEWRVAHGDLNWTNLTAPTLQVLDWETWGLAPRGYDLAYLIVNTGYNLDLMKRLEAAFADELRTPSGRVAQLAACAQMLDFVKGQMGDIAYQRGIEGVAERALSRS